MRRNRLLQYIFLVPTFIITILYLRTQHHRLNDQKKIKNLESKIEKMESANNKSKRTKPKSSKHTPENNALRELMRWEG